MAESVDILNELFVGKLTVTIEGLGVKRIEGIGFEPIFMLVNQVEMAIKKTRESFSMDSKNHPYELVSFDREKAVLVVRKKVT